jgi:hypothetical protein
VLKVVPDNALGAVVINRVAETNDKIRDLAGRLQLPPADLLGTVKLITGLREGVDDKGSLGAAAVPTGPDGPPVGILFVPTTDYQALIKQGQPEDAGEGVTKITLGEKKLLAASKGGYAVLADESDKVALDAVRASTKSIADGFGALDDWRSDTDAYALATPAGIKFAQEKILEGLTVAKDQLGQQGEQGKAALAGIGMYESLFKGCDKEISHCAIGLKMGEDNAVHVVSRTLAVEGGTLAQIAQAAKPAKGNLLAGLPQGPFFFAGGGVLSEDWVKPLMDVSISMFKVYPGGEKLSEDQIKKIIEISMRSMKGIRSMAMMLGVGKPGEPVYSNVLLVMRANNAKRYLENYERAMHEMGKIGKESKHPFLSYDVERLEIDGSAGLRMSVDMKPFFAQQQQIPEVAAMMDKMMELMVGSGGKMDVYMAVADETTILGAYVSKERLVETLKNFREGKAQLADDPLVAKTAAMLPKGSHGVVYWSPSGTLAFVSQLMTTLAPEAAAQIPEFPPTPPLGVAVKLSAGSLDTDLVVPAPVMEAIAELVRKTMATRKPPAGQDL